MRGFYVEPSLELLPLEASVSVNCDQLRTVLNRALNMTGCDLNGVPVEGSGDLLFECTINGKWHTASLCEARTPIVYHRGIQDVLALVRNIQGVPENPHGFICVVRQGYAFVARQKLATFSWRVITQPDAQLYSSAFQLLN